MPSTDKQHSLTTHYQWSPTLKLAVTITLNPQMSETKPFTKNMLIFLCFITPAKCHDSPSNKFYGEAESWEPNDCTVCVCRNGTPECLATVCRHPDCKEPLYIKGQCCPVCPLVDPSSSGHNEAGNNTSHSSIFQLFSI